MTYIPAIGDPDPDALQWINSVWGQIPRDATFRRLGLKPTPLRAFITANSDGIRLQAPFRAAVVAAVELATGLRYAAPADIDWSIPTLSIFADRQTAPIRPLSEATERRIARGDAEVVT